MKPFLCCLLVLFTYGVSFPGRAQAQRGAFVEELFRTIAEAQLEREQRKRLEAERAAREQLPPPGIMPPTRPSRDSSIQVRSAEAAEFVQRLIDFSGAVAPMTRELRSAANRNLEVRHLLPDAYRIDADTRALLAQCDGLASLNPIVEPYARLDSQWRQLSFRLRSMDDLPPSCVDAVRNADTLISRMSRQLQIQPQFDRHQLHDLMIIAATYIQTLMDDLQVARIPRTEMDRLTHDCRLLRQQLLTESGSVDRASYEEVVSQFTDFVSRWNSFSGQLYEIDDLHVQRRLDRISEATDQAYALLWMPPPYNANLIAASAQRLQRQSSELLSQLNVRTLSSLPRQQQIRVLESSYAMSDAVKRFVELAEQRADRAERRRQFTEIDAQWAYLRPAFHQLSAINQATLASVQRECDFLRNGLGMSVMAAQPLDHEMLIEAAASLEGSAEFLMIDVRRYERYVEPESFRRSVVGASQAFHAHAKQLHDALSRRADLAVLQREAGQLLDAWKQLSDDLTHIDGHGLSERRAETLQRTRDELVPVVAKIAAALVQP